MWLRGGTPERKGSSGADTPLADPLMAGTPDLEPGNDTQAGRPVAVPSEDPAFQTDIFPAGPAITDLLDDVYAEFVTWNETHQGEPLSSFSSSLPVVGRDGYVIIDAYGQDGSTPEQALADLESIGMVNGETYLNVISGALPIESIPLLTEFTSIATVSPFLAQTNVGSVTSRGDIAQGSDLARAEFDVDGDGVLVGILSDTFNQLGGLDAGIASGDLPEGIIILDDGEFVSDPSDEGRAMAEIIFDVAPGVDMAFHTAFGGVADFANGILELAELGADVIVDDVFDLNEPFYQIGPVASAVETVRAQGVVYLSSAGNAGSDAYLADFRASSQLPNSPDVPTNLVYHDFDPGAGDSPVFTYTLPPERETFIGLQWPDVSPVVQGGPRATTDLNMFLFDTITGELLDSSTLRVGVPREGFRYENEGETPQQVSLAIGQSPNREQVETFTFIEFSAGGRFEETREPTFNGEFGAPTLTGQANAPGAIAVGAAAWFETPAFGTSPARIETFSSLGGFPIFFDTDGTPFPEPLINTKPEIVAPDGVNTSFFGQELNDGDDFPNFFGTSAAAPHAAGLVALMLDANPNLTPDQVVEIITSTASDMDDPGTLGFDQGFDFQTGFGLLNSVASVREAEALNEGTPVGPDAQEENDTLATATPLGLVPGSLTVSNLTIEEGDPDFFAFETPGTGVAGDQVSVTLQGATGDVALALFDGDGTQIATSDGSPLSLEGLPAGAYVTQVSGVDGATVESYALSILASPPAFPDRFEPNDSFATATDLGTVEGDLSVGDLTIDPGDLDFFSFETTGTGAAGDQVSISFPGTDETLGLTLFDADGMEVGTSEAPGSTSQSVSLSGLAAGTYVASVSGSNDLTSEEYSLSVTATAPPPPPPPTGDPFEPNNTFPTRTNLGSITQSTAFEGLAITPGDNDFLSFTLTETGQEGDSVSILFDNSQGNLNLQLFEGTRFVAISGSFTDNETISLEGLEPGEFTLRVFGLNFSSNPRYDVAFTIAGSDNGGGDPVIGPDTLEDNDSLATATDLGTLNDEVVDLDNLTLEPGDPDFFRFETIGDGGFDDQVTITFQDTGGLLDLALFQEDGTLVANDQGTGSTRFVDLEGLPPGVYVARVTDTAGAGNPSYSLTVDAPGAPVGIQPDGFEENDTLETAAAIGTLNTAQLTAMLTDLTVEAGDDDWFSVALDFAAGAQVDVDLSFIHGDGDVDLEVFDETGQLLAFSESITDGESASFTAETGTAFIRVFGFDGAENPDYDLSVSATPRDKTGSGTSDLGGPGTTVDAPAQVPEFTGPLANLNIILDYWISQGLDPADWIENLGLSDAY